MRIGILGGGQLGLMMINEGRRLPYTFYVMDEQEAPACGVADKCFPPSNYRDMIDSSDVVTFEFEHVSEDALKYASDQGKLLPSIEAVELKRERYKEKEYYRIHGLPTPRFVVARGGEEALRVLKDEFNNRGVIKQSRGGYDGKGQYFVRDQSSVPTQIREMDCTFVVEEFVDFDFEASVIGVRSRKGEFSAYPPTFNLNLKGILVYNYGPFGDPKMVEIVRKLADSLNYVGTLGVEFFVRGNEILINEFAPRVHNTGHYTLDGALFSQFDQHVNAIVGGEPLSTEVTTPSGMVNLLGTEEIPSVKVGKVYWYNKREAKKRRKMGHVNVTGRDLEDVKGKIDILMKQIYNKGLDL